MEDFVIFIIISFFQCTSFCVMRTGRAIRFCIFFLLPFLVSCSILKKKSKPYEYGWVPKDFTEIEKHYNSYANLYKCQPGETIASVGAGNGKFELTISCFVQGIDWYLEDIDSSRLNQFNQVQSHFEKLKGSSVDGQFHLVLGSESETGLPHNYFDRVLMINVYHEIRNRGPVMEDIKKILKPEGVLVVMERMGHKPGEKHGD